MGSKQAKLALENDSDFCRTYKTIQNRQTGEGAKPGSSASVQRRACISSAMNRSGVYGATKMLDVIGMERYFNEKWNLCPYGLRAHDEMEVLSEARYSEEVRVTAIPMGNDQPYALINQFQRTQEIEMAQATNTHTKAPAIETKIFIFGVDASTLSDDQIVASIFDIENEMNRLGAVKNKPKKLEAKLHDMAGDIEALVKYVDGRA